MTSPALEIITLRKQYGSVEAIKGIDLTLQPGEFFGFLGPNGAGKTTTISSIVGISTPTSGTIRVFGHDVVSDYRAARAKVGVSPQEFNIDPFASVEKILDYMGGYYGIPATKRAIVIQKLLTDFELLAHRKKTFMQLSGGLKRRVMIARAMVHDPDLLILDEPTAGVDVELRREIWRFLREINARGKTILLTSHYLEEVQQLCSRIGIISQGKIVYLGQKEDLLKNGKSLEDRYLHYTANGATAPEKE
jgi:ABC-2 type transport system ATP-binding protein